MGNTYLLEIEQASKQLICINFKLEPGHQTFLIILMNSFIQVTLIVIHDYIKELFIIFISEERIFH